MIMNRLFTALLLSALSSISFSQQAFANRPAAEEPVIEGAGIENNSQLNNTARSTSPSSVDIMMQQQQTGDVVTLPAKEMQPGETLKIKLLDSPHRGMSMAKVKNEFGQPDVISNSVGKPPITHWTYSDRIVYFEYSTVLHVVTR